MRTFIAWLPPTRLGPYRRRSAGDAAVQQHGPRLDARDLQQARGAPGIGGETRPRRLLGGRVDDEQHLLARAERPAEDDEPFGGERVHEDGVLGPAGLRAHGERPVPGRPPHAPHRKIRRHYAPSSIRYEVRRLIFSSRITKTSQKTAFSVPPSRRADRTVPSATTTSPSSTRRVTSMVGRPTNASFSISPSKASLPQR